jgi:hypothetical protein
MTQDDFEVGKVYFSCGYLLRFKPVPLIDAAVFIGKNIHGRGEDGDLHYFQNVINFYREEANFEAMEHETAGYGDEEGDGIFSVPSEHVADFATDLKGLKYFVGKLDQEMNARDVFSGLD